MGSPYLFTLQQTLKRGVFYWLRVKNSNHLHTELNLGYLKDTNFYRESKALFIHISSIASFKPFFMVWWWEYCTFSDSSVVSLSPRLGQNTPSTELFPQKSHVLLSNFFLLQICYLLDCSQQIPEKKKSGVTVLV